MEQYFSEAISLKQASLPASAQAGALTGARASMRNGDRLAVIVSMGGSTGSTVSLALKQHNAATGGVTKALASPAPYFKKAGAATTSTKVVPDVATDTFDLSADFAAAEGVVVFNVLAEDLDVNGGFSHVSLDVAASGTAKVFSVVYALHNTKSKPAYQVVF